MNDDEGDERPSRSARKRAAQSAQELGERLVDLPDVELAELDLPPELLVAIRDARRITSRAAGARQRQFIGKLMRDIDCEPIAAALAARGKRDALEAQRFARVESWRERLLREGDAALAELAALHPDADLTQVRALLTRSHSSLTNTARAAQRDLFRALRALLG
jgi:ribosome-associated protein